MTEEISYYPITDILDSGHLDVGEGHQVYWQTQGNPKGIPVVIIHGGPGGSISDSKPALLNPEKYYIISYDQRGCGKSTPLGELHANTVPHLIDDLELLREALGLATWTVLGGSWGSTVALYYGHAVPEVIDNLIVYGVWLARSEELDASYAASGIAASFFPDLYADFVSILSEEQKKDPLNAYAELFQSHDADLKKKAIIEWGMYEYQLLRLLPQPRLSYEELEADFISMAQASKIMMHYWQQRIFFDQGDALLKTIGDKLKGKTVHVVQGRYDMVCPFKTAWEVHKAIPHSTLHVIPDAGHLTKEPGTTRKLIEIFDQL